MKNAALLIIDVQSSFEHRPYWREDDLPAFQEKLKMLVTGCVAQKVPIVRILHVEPSGAFARESGWVKPMSWVPEAHDVVFEKQVHNAFTGTALDAWLRDRRIRRVMVSGIRTEQCCETTARVASDLGYEVDFVTEATLTFPMVHAPSGRAYSTAEIKDRTELVLDGRFARIRTAAECLAGG
jgi:nicotinamidase-related amidase